MGVSAGRKPPCAAEPKLAQRVAELIERDIIRSERDVGKSLGAEAELVARYGVSRSVLREALVLVAGGGLARVRRGQAGGLIVSAPSEDLVAASLQNYLDFVAGGFEEIWAIRRELEDLALILAIKRLTAEDIVFYQQLQARFRQASDNRAKLALGAEMLRRMTATSRNPVLYVLIVALSSLTVERLSRSGARLASLLWRAEEIANFRSEQLAAVLAAAPGRALEASARIFAIFRTMAAQPAAGGEPGAADQASVLTLVAPTLAPQKLAEKVARRIKNRIVSEGLVEGARLGQETELMATYGASRGVIREAIRILERLSVVSMVRGKGGGLRVLTPNADSIVRSTCVYLRSLKVRMSHCQEVGEVMGLVAVDMAARNVATHDPAKVRAAVSGLAELKNATLRELVFAHYNVIGDLSDSRATGLIMSVLANLFALDESPDTDQLIVREVVPERLRDLIDAILQGDRDLARRRMIALRRSGARVRLRPLAVLATPELLNVVKRAPNAPAV
jgi:DNA-binding FadR family transcriptional regulator